MTEANLLSALKLPSAFFFFCFFQVSELQHTYHRLLEPVPFRLTNSEDILGVKMERGRKDLQATQGLPQPRHGAWRMGVCVCVLHSGSWAPALQIWDLLQVHRRSHQQGLVKF